MPGRGNVIAGQTGVFRTAGSTTSAMALRFPAGVLVNLGEVPKQTYAGKLPSTRMGTASLVRTILTQAQGYARKMASKDEDKRPPRNLKMDGLEPVINGKIPMIFSAHRADDISTALRLAQEFGIQARIDLATEGYLVADQLAASKVPVVVHPTMQRVGGSLETYHSHLCNAALLAERKIPLAIGTAFEGYVPKTRVLRHEAAMALVNGLGWDGALRAITLDAAKILKLDHAYGSLDVGKTADLVLYDGDPFEHSTHVTYTVIGGRIVFHREEHLKLPFDRRALPLAGGGGIGCCLGVW
jgi:imidazolonepropionase-like amidohydrolase